MLLPHHVRVSDTPHSERTNLCSPLQMPRWTNLHCKVHSSQQQTELVPCPSLSRSHASRSARIGFLSRESCLPAVTCATDDQASDPAVVTAPYKAVCVFSRSIFVGTSSDLSPLPDLGTPQVLFLRILPQSHLLLSLLWSLDGHALVSTSMLCHCP